MALEERLDRAEKIFHDPSFLRNKGAANEVGYYIFDYMPEHELRVRQWVEQIQKKYESPMNGFSVVVFDLYELMISILQGKGYLEKCFEFEKTRGFERITQAVGNALRLTSKDNSLIINRICQNTPENCIVFITGVGKAYPVIRAHTILNNLHQVLDRVPVVMFYPGKYDRQELILFGEIQDSNYYRAFKLVE